MQIYIGMTKNIQMYITPIPIVFVYFNFSINVKNYDPISSLYLYFKNYNC